MSGKPRYRAVALRTKLAYVMGPPSSASRSAGRYRGLVDDLAAILEEGGNLLGTGRIELRACHDLVALRR